MPKIDAKEVALDGDEGKEILASLSIFEKYNPVSVYEILVNQIIKTIIQSVHI